jgi:hypothetical protein
MAYETKALPNTEIFTTLSKAKDLQGFQFKFVSLFLNKLYKAGREADWKRVVGALVECSTLTSKLMATIKPNGDLRPLQVVPVVARIYGSAASFKWRSTITEYTAARFPEQKAFRPKNSVFTAFTFMQKNIKFK